MAETGTQYSNFKDAYCAVHRCPPDGFVAHVFSRSLGLGAAVLGRLFGLKNQDLFGPDFEAIEAIGAATSITEFQQLLDDLDNRRLVERSFRRQTLGVRSSTARLNRLLRPLAVSIRPPAPVVPTSPVVRSALEPAGPRPRLQPERPGEATPPDSKEGGTLMVRRLRRFHADVVAGRPIEAAAKNAGFKLEEIPGALSEHKADFADLNWLLEQLVQRDEVSRLRTENEQLRRVVADLSARVLAATGRV